MQHVTGSDGIKTCQDIRMEVFVQGQNVPVELELEYEDQSEHFLATVNGRHVGTGRLRVTEPYIKVERVILCPHANGLYVECKYTNLQLNVADSIGTCRHTDFCFAARCRTSVRLV